MRFIVFSIGSDTEKQALAVECFCNLSLGSPMSCEIVALKAGSYFHTFLTSSNEWLVVRKFMFQIWAKCLNFRIF